MSYTHGGDIYRNIVEYDFSVNINPLGMPLGSIRAAHEAILLAGRYPDYKGEKLCRAIAGYKNVDVDNIILGNGAAELIYTLCYAVKPRRALLAVPTFSEYEKALKAVECEIDSYYLRETEEFELGEEFVDCITEDIDIIFLCNPNNPTGRLIKPDIMMRILNKCARHNVYLCVDECFLPFVTDENRYTLTGEIAGNKQLIVLRAFTKIYAMAGLRLGYALTSNKELLSCMRSKLQPWNTSAVAQMAGVEALKDREFLDKTRELIEMERNYLMYELSQGMVDRLYAGEANFIMFKADENLYDKLMEQGIMIRSCADFEGLNENYYRIGVRSHSENQELIRRWRRMA